MQVFINGTIVHTTAKTLEELMLSQNFTQNWLATAVNNDLIKKENRATYNLKDGDKIEILSPMQGG